MKKLLIVLVLLAIVGGGVGYQRGWFEFKKTDGHDGNSNLDVTVHKEKFQADKAAFLKSAAAKLTVLQERLHAMRSTSKDLTGDAKAKADKEIRELEQKHGTLDAKLKDVDKATKEEFEGVKGDLSRSLDEFSRDSDK